MCIVTREDIKEFRKTRKRIVKELKFSGGNPGTSWHIYRGSFRPCLRGAVMEFCKLLPPCGMKNWLYRRMGVNMGRNVAIAPGVVMDPFYPELISIGDNVIIGWGARIFTHEITHKRARFGSVVIGDNSLIGEFSLLMPGVTIGRSSVVAAMSFVNKDVGDYEEVGGVPEHLIKRIKRRENEKESQTIKDQKA